MAKLYAQFAEQQLASKQREAIGDALAVGALVGVCLAPLLTLLS